jgi:hypothetical protein
VPGALNPTLVASFLDYVSTRGIFVDLARVRSPKDKPRVENHVTYVRESWCDGETFTDLGDAQRSAEHWSREIASMRHWSVLNLTDARRHETAARSAVRLAS